MFFLITMHLGIYAHQITLDTFVFQFVSDVYVKSRIAIPQFAEVLNCFLLLNLEACFEKYTNKHKCNKEHERLLRVFDLNLLLDYFFVLIHKNFSFAINLFKLLIYLNERNQKTKKNTSSALKYLLTF